MNNQTHTEEELKELHRRDALAKAAFSRKEPTYSDPEWICPLNHDSHRYTQSKLCVECVSENCPEVIKLKKRPKPRNANTKNFEQQRRNEILSTLSLEVRTLDNILVHHTRPVSIKRRSRKTIEQYCCRHKLESYDGPCNDTVATFE